MKITLDGICKTPLQVATLSIARQFESNHKLRKEFLCLALASGAYILEDWEYKKLPKTYLEFGSKVYLRERVRAYLMMIGYVLSMIRGVRPVPGDISAKVEDLRSAWLGSVPLRDAVSGLESALNQSFDWFNFQMITCYMKEAVMRVKHIHDGVPSFLQQIDLSDSRKELQDLENYAYGRAKSCYVACSRATDVLEKVDVSEGLRKLFLLSPEELVRYGAMLRDPELAHHFMKEEEEKEKVVVEVPKRRQTEWVKSEGGILIPQ